MQCAGCGEGRRGALTMVAYFAFQSSLIARLSIASATCSASSKLMSTWACAEPTLLRFLDFFFFFPPVAIAAPADEDDDDEAVDAMLPSATDA